MNRKNVLSRAHRHRNERSSGNFAHVGESVKTQISNDASPIGCAVGATTDHRHDADWPAVPVARWARDRRAPAGEELDERANWTTTTCWFLAWRAVYSAISALPAVLTSATRVPRSALSGRLDAGRTRTARRRGRQRPGASRDRAARRPRLEALITTRPLATELDDDRLVTSETSLPRLAAAAPPVNIALNPRPRANHLHRDGSRLTLAAKGLLRARRSTRTICPEFDVYAS
jgi:hypothetical protein